MDHVSSYYKFKTPTLLYDQQIQKRDELERQLNLIIDLKLKRESQSLQLLANRLNLKISNNILQVSNKSESTT